MTGWTATGDRGSVLWDGTADWTGTPGALADQIRRQLRSGLIQALPLCPTFDPAEDLERALIAAIIRVDGSMTFTEGAPVDDVVPPIPPGSVS